MNAKLIVCVVAGALAGLAHAAQDPIASKDDPRIRFVDYNPNNVVTIYGKVGTSTMILFEPDEQLVDMVGGDTDAWQAASTGRRNGVFFKPAVTAPATNIQVITNKRAYNLDMKLAAKKDMGYLTVRFRYPADEQAAEAKARKQERIEALLQQTSPVRNRSYTVQGADELAPVEAWDDGAVTYLRFAARSPIPAIYAASGDGDELERVVNVNVTPDGVVEVHGVRRKFVLRSGSTVACVFNERFDAGGAAPVTKTSSPRVERIVKGGTQ
ncbi:TrbG/VirB9 family P-type conjugative transfer protein [Massilia pinisoli]|uniref:TrbG/VirB9 family P-type conjugative transfer protein n=1 Tax=Massilia pinisoli TaxID=1772194 RepID=A0ABT2A003_9BURK|nr:TrbG/VirB9 family P-type conjugative transfer protein [Massilia pinisoli]MCS0585421.1 TrbG/VirB9 family P-type conjugative transfer protein [Massilia pinisoli]